MWILHCDDHAAFSTAFRSLVEAKGHAVASVPLSMVIEHHPVERDLVDVIVLEVNDVHGGEIHDLRQHFPEVPLVALTRLEHAGALAELEGVDGLVLKRDRVDDALDVMSKVISLSSRPGRRRIVWSTCTREVILKDAPTAV